MECNTALHTPDAFQTNLDLSQICHGEINIVCVVYIQIDAKVSCYHRQNIKNVLPRVILHKCAMPFLTTANVEVTFI